MTAFWAPHTVGGRPRCALDTGPGTWGGRTNFPIPGLVQDSGFRGKSIENERKSRNGRTAKINNLPYQSEGFPLTGYFVPACVGIWAWASQKNCRRVVVAAVGVSFLNARFSKEKLDKMMFLWRI